MIGDRPDTDIAGAKRMGIRTALVRTGCFGKGESIAEEGMIPDWDFTDMEQLLLQFGLKF